MLWLCLGASLVSFSPILVKLAPIGPSEIAFYRLFIGGSGLLIACLFAGIRLPFRPGPFLLALATGAFFALDLFCFHRSVVYIGAVSTILANLQVFFLAIAGMIFLGERPGQKLAIAIPLAMIGLVMLVGPSWPASKTGYKLGVFLGILTALFYTGYIFFLRQAQARLDRLNPAAHLAVVSLIGAAMMAAVVLAEGGSFHVPNGQTWLILLGYGLGCHALGWFFISLALPHLEASRAGLNLLLQPTLSFVWDVILLHRPTPLIDWAGAALLIGSIYLGGISYKKSL